MSHAKYVQRLYKRSLKLAYDWYWQRSEYREKALIIRQLFENNRHLSNQIEITQHLRNTELLLAKYAHPQPYIAPTAPNGTKWERNIPVPQHVIDKGVTLLDNYS
jgi:NADH dehydrogenase (ubiquinone) 1 beta subcomplex subunit 9